MSAFYFLLLIAKYIIAPILVFTRFKRDPLIVVFGICGIFTMNTSLMAVIRDFGGMEWLQAIGREPWFRHQYAVAYWMSIASSIALIAFFLRLAFTNAADAAIRAADDN